MGFQHHTDCAQWANIQNKSIKLHCKWLRSGESRERTANTSQLSQALENKCFGPISLKLPRMACSRSRAGKMFGNNPFFYRGGELQDRLSHFHSVHHSLPSWIFIRQKCDIREAAVAQPEPEWVIVLHYYPICEVMVKNWDLMFREACTLCEKTQWFYSETSSHCTIHWTVLHVELLIGMLNQVWSPGREYNV